ncbi:MAG: glycosyltransferase family 2 protein [Nitrosospira sp.]|nr:glycosyltransferase family 2 protein [Nitrosospira sp.]
MNAQLFLSIALATYNGERYIGEQLDSIASQTRLPDELVISDDASVDATPAIVLDFARRAPFPVRFQTNSERLGSTRNFELAIRACDGDIIFLCDQDDVWYPDKIALIEERFMNDPGVGAVFTDADVVDQDLHPSGLRLWKAVRFGSQEQARVADHDAFPLLLKQFVVTGATMAFRSTYRELVLPIPGIWVHDAWIALLISATSHLAALPEPLIAYRQHGANQIGLPRPGKNRSKTRAAIYEPRLLRHEAAKTRLLGFADRLPDGKRKIRLLDDKLVFLRACAGLPDARWRRLPAALRELVTLRYHRYAKGGIWTFRRDLLH